MAIKPSSAALLTGECEAAEVNGDRAVYEADVVKYRFVVNIVAAQKNVPFVSGIGIDKIERTAATVT